MGRGGSEKGEGEREVGQDTNLLFDRDLTPSNVLLNRKGQAKISDLGLARVKRVFFFFFFSFVLRLLYLCNSFSP